MVLIIVLFDDFLERIDVFYECFPLFAPSFELIFYLDSVVIMFSVKHNAVDAKKLLGSIFASFYIAIESLDVSSVASALDIVSGGPIVND